MKRFCVFAAFLVFALTGQAVLADEMPGGSDEELLSFVAPSVLQKARAGDRIAQHLIAGAFLGGKLTQRDVPKAIYWARLAADQGLTMAQVLLARQY
jgi:TPR repeat protein